MPSPFARNLLVTLTLCNFLIFWLAVSSSHAQESETKSSKVARVPFTVELQTILKHDDDEFHWFHPRATVHSSNSLDQKPAALLTILKHLRASDHYSGTYVMHSNDLGKTWTEPVMPAELDWVHDANKVDIAVADVTPIFHARSGKVIAVGAQVRYNTKGEEIEDQVRSHQTAYAVFDPETKKWSPWRRLEMPPDERYNFARSACAQMVIEPTGNLLLPFYVSESARNLFRTQVVRCSFDGAELKFVEAGNELKLDVPRGLYEPSLINHAGMYYLTLRNDVRGYVTTSADGLNYSEIKPWTFDDGAELGSYNTQQHWVSNGDALYLSYTRRGANNDHIVRHRAPLFIAQVDPQELVVLRDTEKILMPERGATFGNFGATQVSSTEAWVTDAEGIFRPEDRKRGAEGAVYLARVKWEKPGRRAMAPATDQRLRAGQETKIVCFGDSVTGVYYHTGSRRAYPEMLEIALRKTYAHDKVSVINAGISGHTTRDALARIEKDVLAHKPNLVTVMFGLNDMVRIPPQEFQENLRQIIDKCRAIGAEVILCTPNNIIENGGRPIKKLEEYSALMQVVGKEKQVPVADICAELNELKAKSPAEWRLTMSDEIHPNMAGHKITAGLLSFSISQQPISLKDVPPSQPRLKALLAKAKAGQHVKILAMAPGNDIIHNWLRDQVPDGKFEVIPWKEPAKKTLSAWAEDAKQRVRQLKPDFVLLCPPQATSEDTKESVIHDYTWLMNWALEFGIPSWDCVVVHPNVFGSIAEPVVLDDTTSDELLEKLVPAQDLMLISRNPDDNGAASAIIGEWFAEQLAKEESEKASDPAVK